MTFDYAVELLEITDIHHGDFEGLPKIIKKAKRRWHPDTISHLKDQELIAEYTQKFQAVEEAGKLIEAYLNGTFEAGEAYQAEHNSSEYREPEEIIRENATDLQEELKTYFSKAREFQFKWTQQEVLLSDGFKLKELIDEDFKDDVVGKAFMSWSYGLFLIMIFTVLGGLISTSISGLGAIIMLIYTIICMLAAIPLSRIWMPEALSNIVIKVVNFGLGIQEFFLNRAENSGALMQLTVSTPFIISRIFKYLILWPLSEVAKLIVGDRVVGVVYQTVEYYAGAAEWYIEALINSNPENMTSEELYHLSYIHGDLQEVKSL
jgi:hypothetical protein